MIPTLKCLAPPGSLLTSLYLFIYYLLLLQFIFLQTKYKHKLVSITFFHIGNIICYMNYVAIGICGVEREKSDSESDPVTGKGTLILF